MKYLVNENCIGCGACAGICPDVFELGGDGYAHVVADPKSDTVRETAAEAMASCPTSAIEEA